MTWNEFLSQAAQIDTLTIVGPLRNEPHAATTPTIYIDGGSACRLPSNQPTVRVGDGDSSQGPLDEILPAEKNFSDLSFVLRGLPQNIIRVDMHGFLGGRRDHELANFGEVHHFLSQRSHFSHVSLWSDEREEVIAFCKGRVSLNFNGLFSVFVFESTAVKITGACKYHLNREHALSLISSHGLSNESHGPIEIESGRPAFIFLNYN